MGGPATDRRAQTDDVGRWGISRFVSIAVTALSAGAAFCAIPAAAQDATSVAGPAPSGPMPMCLFRLEPVPQNTRQTLVANCRGRAFLLGFASDYQVVRNENLQATLVDVHNGPERKILLISMQASGQPLLEDLSGELALAAGRGPLSDLTGVTLDFTTFAADGQVAVQGRPEDTGPARTSSIGIGQQIAMERSRQAGLSAAN